MKDDTTWEYDLREDVSFHDGYGDVIADDFVWSIERLQETDASPYLPKVTPIEQVEATDDYRLEINLAHPFAPWPVYSTRNSNATTLVSQQYMDEVGQDEYTRMPIGTGPFMVDEREAGEYVKVVKHEDYHETDDDGNPLPYLDEIYFNAIPEPSTQWSALQSNDIQFIRNMPPALADQVEGTGAVENMTFEPINAGYWYNLSLLCNDPAEHTDWVEYLGGEVTDKWQGQDVPTYNADVRRAISKAIDREELAQDAYFGYAEPQSTMWNPYMQGYEELEENPDVGQQYDPEGAEQLLEEAGYTGDPRVSFSILAPTDREREMTVIQQQLAEVGIDAELDIRPEADYWGAIYSFNNEVSAYSGGAFFTNDESWRRQLHTPTEEGDGTYQKGLYSNEELDGIMDQAFKTVDEDEKLQLLREGTEIITQEAPYVMTVGPQNIMVWRDGLKGFRNPVGATLFDRAWLDE
jgi:peptide/nickel transport system substrate-binding protein